MVLITHRTPITVRTMVRTTTPTMLPITDPASASRSGSNAAVPRLREPVGRVYRLVTNPTAKFWLGDKIEKRSNRGPRMPQSTHRYRGYVIDLEWKHGGLLVSVAPATPDLPILVAASTPRR